MNDRHLIIRADASTEIGAGHVMRCLAIAQAWQDNGGTVQFTSVELAPSMQSRLKNEGIQTSHLDCNVGSEQDASLTVGLCSDTNAQALVVDGYRFSEGYLQTIADQPTFTLTIDDNALLSSYPTDFVLNPNVAAAAEKYPKLESNTRLLLGSNYTLLRREFLDSAAAKDRANTNSDPLKILVTMGGSDPDNVTHKVVSALLQRDSVPMEAHVVVGAMNQHHEELSELVQNDKRITVLRDVANMATEYQWADLAISAGGGSNWEMSRLGVPRVLIVIADNQVATALACEEANTAINLGLASEVSAAEITAAIEGLSNDRNRLTCMSENSSKLIDGLGAQRVTQQLALLKARSPKPERAASSVATDGITFRPATMQDAQMLLDWRNDATTTAASRHSEAIDLPAHTQWLRECLANNDRRLQIAEFDGQPVGTIRIDLGDPRKLGEPCELSWTVAPVARGQGIGRSMVREFASQLSLPTKAVTRTSNIASQKVAQSAGFEFVEKDDEWMTFMLNLNPTC